MYFKRLEMQGFKSFADPVTIELTDGITCIVGPNGSGKSNISDAIRWVIGEQSPKSLRGGKMEDVIFAGTATRKPKGMAEVTLVIDNSTGILPVEYQEVAVTRRMYRSGESEYRINGNECRLRDIKEMFMDTGIGVDGYSIIGQGRIAEIVSTKPENRREIFEEAAGVVLYKSRKAEAERKLANANDNLERVKDIINEIEGRIDGLREDSDKATEFIELRDRYKYLQVNIILHNIAGLERSVEASTNDLKELAFAVERKFKETEELDELAEQQRVTDAELSEAYDRANKELRAKTEELNLITNRDQLNTERLAAIERDITRINEEIKEAEAKLTAESDNLNELEGQEKALADRKSEVEETLSAAIIKFNEHTTKANIVKEEIEKQKSQIIDLTNGNVSKKAEIQTLENYKNTLEDRQQQIQAEFKGRDETDAQNKARLAEIVEAYDKKESEAKQINGEIDEIADKIISVNQRLVDISTETEQTINELNSAIARKNTIEEMENNYEGYSNSVRRIMQKSFRGIIGTVSDLIRVPDGYELAIETALGGNLQNIVCEDDASAKSVIEWLKSAKAGRATFLPVKSVKADPLVPDKAILQMPGYIGIASDIAESDSKYDEVVKHLLCRVILADTMDNAIKMSKHKLHGFRIVTLEGEVITAAGAITGGAFVNKSANLLERKKEIETLAQRIKELGDKRDKLVSERVECEEQLKDRKERRGDLYDKIRQIEIDKSVLVSDKEHAESLVATSQSAHEKFEDEIATIKGDVDRATKMVEKYRGEIEAADAEIAKLEQSVEALLDDSQRYTATVEQDNEEIVSNKIALSEQEQKILGLNEMIERVRDTASELEMTLEGATDELTELEAQRNLLTSTGAESGEKESKLRAEKEALEAKIGELQLQSDKNRLSHEETIQNQKSASNELSEMQDNKYKLEIKSAKNETLLQTQKDKLWEEFEVSYAEAVDMRDDDFAITSGNKDAREIRLRIAELGDVNISSIEEYKAVSKRYEFMTAQEADITKAMNELRGIISNMDKTIREKFKENFDQVVINFESTFKELFGGGNAELRLEDENNPLDSGIEIIAQPPGKKLKNINLMSGGEKTLTAIALMFAVLKAKPTPFCILDEVEAALDEANIERFSAYLKNFSEVQFALITHQKATMEYADVLYGVTMPEKGISRMLSLKLGDAFDVEGLE